MSIVQEAYAFVQDKLLPNVRPKHKGLFQFGFEALTLRPFVSLNGNARITIPVRNTAQSKMYRVMAKKHMLSYFCSFVSSLRLVRSSDTINVDFSTFCGYNVLTFAQQTQLGRALPLYFAVIKYPVDEGSQTLFIKEEITKFVEMLGFTPTFVFDRGFESPYIIPFLVEKQIPFIVRFRKDKHIIFEGKDIPLYNLPWYEKDCFVGIYSDKLQDKLRIIVSEKLSEREDSNGNKEPWYLLTNIPEETKTKEEIVAMYYFRFEIEETFKDVKHIFELKKFYRIQKQQTFKVLLWFVVLGIWLAFILEKPKQYLLTRITKNKQGKLSIVRFLYEQVQLEFFLAFRHSVF